MSEPHGHETILQITCTCFLSLRVNPSAVAARLSPYVYCLVASALVKETLGSCPLAVRLSWPCAIVVPWMSLSITVVAVFCCVLCVEDLPSVVLDQK